MRTTVTLVGCGGKGSLLDELTAGGSPGPSSDPSGGPSGDPSGGSSDPNDPEFPNTARPPVRMLEVGASLGALEFHSICQDDYSAAIAAIAQP